MNAFRRAVAFVRLARPPFLIGGFAGFGLGAAVAHFDGHPLDAWAYVWGQTLVTAFHLMVHFANDYYDQETDALTVRTAWSGGSGVLPAGELSPAVALIAALACAAIGVVATIHAALTGATLLAGVGVAIAALAWSYSAPPMRLLARGLGELDTLAVVAVLVPLAGYVSFAHALAPHAFVACLPGACAMFAMMLSVELPDARADTATGKRNLVVRWGAKRAVAVARACAVSAVVALVAVGASVFGAPPALLVAALPVAAVAAAFGFAARPLLGVALYATTTCAALAIVAAAA